MAEHRVAPRQRLDAARARDAALGRLRHVTVALTAGAAILTGVFAGIGAASVPGRKVARVAPKLHRHPRSRPRRTEVPAPAPPLPASSAAEVPAPPATAPTATGAPPVVVSGGS